MPLPRRKQTALVYPKTETIVSNERTGYAEGSAATVLCQITEKTPQDALEMFGYDCVAPAVMLFNEADVASVKLGFRVVSANLTYHVVTEPQVMNALTRLNHCRVLLERVMT
jgi:hypothetical protein